jgi:hypothetical protein
MQLSGAYLNQGTEGAQASRENGISSAVVQEQLLNKACRGGVYFRQYSAVVAFHGIDRD